MSDTTTELLRINLLRQLAATYPVRLGIARLHNGTTIQGFEEGLDELGDQLEALRGKGMVDREKGELSATSMTYGLTDKGAEFCEKKGWL